MISTQPSWNQEFVASKEKLRRWLCVDQADVCDNSYFDEREKKEAKEKEEKEEQAKKDSLSGIDDVSKLLGGDFGVKGNAGMKELKEKVDNMGGDTKKEIEEKSKENTAKNFPDLQESKDYLASEAGQKAKANADSEADMADQYEDVTSKYSAEMNDQASDVMDGLRHLQPKADQDL